MKFRFTIAWKLGITFGILLVAILLNMFLTHRTVEHSKHINLQNRRIYSPSAQLLNDLLYTITNSKMLIKNWVHIDKLDDTPDKASLKQLHAEEYPAIKVQLDSLSEHWAEKDRETYHTITHNIDSLFDMHRYIMQQLSSFSAYSDPLIVFEAHTMVDQAGDVTQLTDSVISELSALQAKQQSIVETSSNSIVKSFDKLEDLLLGMGLMLIIVVFTGRVFTTRAIVRPVKNLRSVILSMGKGVLPKETLKITADEIGEMTEALNTLINSLRTTSNFALKIGQGQFHAQFTPLSNNDTLGNSLLEMRKSLQDAQIEEQRRKELEQKNNWTSEGLAKLGDLLRQHREIEPLANAVLRFIVRYLQAVQGGFFIYNDDESDDIHLELVASVAYNHEKNLQRKIYPGDGLVGDCAIEKRTNYITGLPENYIKLASTFGEESPRVLLLLPLLLDDKLIGIFEITSLKELAAYKIKFVEQAANRIAASVSSIKNNERTLYLLEQSRQQAAQLASQEEELRQNLEELRATQDEMYQAQQDLEEANQQLKKNEEELEQKVLERTAEVVKQKEVIEQKNQDITDSINYAKRIQEAILPKESYIKQQLPELFIFFRPRDIVSGDFYWYAEKNGKIVITAVDCTGHGVPGAFMSMVGDSYLNQIIESREIVDAGRILTELNRNVRMALKQDETENQDGMDMALCVIDKEKRQLEFAGAKNPFIYIQDGELHQIKGERQGIGGFQKNKDFRYSRHIVPLDKPTVCYIYSDGFQDQLGGKKSRKFLTKNFRRLLFDIHTLPFDQQKEQLATTFSNWCGTSHPQLDDVLVIGFKVE